MIAWTYHEWYALSRLGSVGCSFSRSIEPTLTKSLKEKSSPNKGTRRWLCQVIDQDVAKFEFVISRCPSLLGISLHVGEKYKNWMFSIGFDGTQIT